MIAHRPPTQGVKHCEERNASIAEIFGGVRAGDERFDVAEQYHHVFWMGESPVIVLLRLVVLSYVEQYRCSFG